MTRPTDPHQSPRLEVIHRQPAEPTGRPPVLFVHGSFSGAWLWAEHFLDCFARAGFPAYALSLRGHGASEGGRRLAWTRLGEFLNDVERVADQLDRAPVLVGHSMGGMVVQKYLEQHPSGPRRAPAAVLMASVPPDGVGALTSHIALTNPVLFWELNLIQWGGTHFATHAGLRRAIFSPGTPEELVRRHFKHMQAESQRVVLDLMGADLPRRLPPAQLQARGPVLVLGAERDALVPVPFVASTARAFATRATIFPRMAHAMMLEPGWQGVADHILHWLDDQGL